MGEGVWEDGVWQGRDPACKPVCIYIHKDNIERCFYIYKHLNNVN